MRLGHSVPNRKGKLVLKLKRTGDFDMTNSAFPTFDGANPSAAEASLEFDRFRVLLRQRQLLADGVPIELGTRAFELLLALLEANRSLVSKEQLLARIWPGIAVAEDNVKVHVCALRKALGEDRDYIRTEFGRGYRFIAAVHSTVAWTRRQRPLRWRHESTQALLPRRTGRRPSHGWSVDCLGRSFDFARGAGAAFRRDQTA
jgi:DNA-binding winged helix-turn-helix (wHTH) protein